MRRAYNPSLTIKTGSRARGRKGGRGNDERNDFLRTSPRMMQKLNARKLPARQPPPLHFFPPTIRPIVVLVIPTRSFIRVYAREMHARASARAHPRASTTSSISSHNELRVICGRSLWKVTSSIFPGIRALSIVHSLRSSFLDSGGCIQCIIFPILIDVREPECALRKCRVRRCASSCWKSVI